MTGDTLLSIRRRKKRKNGDKKSGGGGRDGDGTKNGKDGRTNSKESENIGIGAYEYLLIRIDEVIPGDEVLSLNERSESLEYARINKLMDMGVQETYELTTKSGRKIKTTAEHPFLTQLNKKTGGKYA